MWLNYEYELHNFHLNKFIVYYIQARILQTGKYNKPPTAYQANSWISKIDKHNNPLSRNQWRATHTELTEPKIRESDKIQIDRLEIN